MWPGRETTVQTVEKLSSALIRAGKMPRQCDLSRIGPLHMAALHSNTGSLGLIHETVACGMGTDQNTAILKGLVECAERLAIARGRKLNLPVCRTSRSDGFAAFPTRTGAEERARANALNEAIERFAWARWWDDDSIDADVERFEPGDPIARSLVQAIFAILPAEELLLVRPRLESRSNELLIFFLRLRESGVVSGGACGGPADREGTTLRGLGELARHAECVRRLRAGSVAWSFYERRLAHMATAAAEDALDRRLDAGGAAMISLPALSIDVKVPHDLEDEVVVHRCLFENQPPFVGGALERLCL